MESGITNGNGHGHGEMTNRMKNCHGCCDDDISDDRDSRSDSGGDDFNKDAITMAFQSIIEHIGEDSGREGLQSTPMRAMKAIKYLTAGYNQTVESVIGEGLFHENVDSQMVTVKNIDICSLCEHHLLPFYGKIHISYVPKKQILGLSKVSRIADIFARRLQVQERLTKQIAEAIMDATDAQGVGVIIEAVHLCMVMRGVEKPGSTTVTSCFLGSYLTDSSVKTEFMLSVNSKNI